MLREARPHCGKRKPAVLAPGDGKAELPVSSRGMCIKPKPRGHAGSLNRAKFGERNGDFKRGKRAHRYFRVSTDHRPPGPNPKFKAHASIAKKKRSVRFPIHFLVRKDLRLQQVGNDLKILFHGGLSRLKIPQVWPQPQPPWPGIDMNRVATRVTVAAHRLLGGRGGTSKNRCVRVLTTLILRRPTSFAVSTRARPAPAPAAVAGTARRAARR